MKLLRRLKAALIVLLGGLPFDLDSGGIDKIKDKLLKLADDIEESRKTKKDELRDIYLFDFKLGYQSNFDPDFIDLEQPTFSENDKRIEITPIKVLKELERVPRPFELNFLDEKMVVLHQKSELIKQKYVKYEFDALIFRIENRKKYNEFYSYFSKFDNTTEEKIDIILDKYKLVMKDANLFIPEFPDEAVKVMSSYTEKLKELCGKKPIFYVVAEDKDFKKKYEKRDPILLVQSPFGFYYQILGAWGEEMLILSEL